MKTLNQYTAAFSMLLACVVPMSQTGAAPIQMQGDPAGIVALQTIEKEWNLAAHEWSADKLAALYTKNAVLFGGRPNLSQGQDGVRAYYNSYVGILKSATLELVDQHIVELASDTYLAQGYGNFHFWLSGGKESDARMRTTLVLIRHDNRWRILGHHFSTIPEAPPIPK